VSQTVLQWSGELIQGRETTVTVVDDLSHPIVGATVRATWRTGLEGERDVAVGLTDARGQVPWTPDQNGTVLLAVRDVNEVVQVGPLSPGPTEIILMVAILVVACSFFTAGSIRLARDRRSQTP